MKRYSRYFSFRTALAECLLRCMTRHFNITQTRGNCNMLVYNYCVYKSRCNSRHPIEPSGGFVNPFRQNCLDKYYVIHNKCNGTEDRLCMYRKKGELVMTHDTSEEVYWCDFANPLYSYEHMYAGVPKYHRLPPPGGYRYMEHYLSLVPLRLP